VFANAGEGAEFEVSCYYEQMHMTADSVYDVLQGKEATSSILFMTS
jgi:hypothetical protein